MCLKAARMHRWYPCRAHRAKSLSQHRPVKTDHTRKVTGVNQMIHFFRVQLFSGTVELAAHRIGPHQPAANDSTECRCGAAPQGRSLKNDVHLCEMTHNLLMADTRAPQNYLCATS